MCRKSEKKSKCTMEKAEMIKLYLEGSSTSDIANLANVSSRYVRMVLTDNNIEKRARGSWKRKYDLDEDYFKIWSNNMAYILGFFVADGVIAKNSHTVSISQKEKEILEDMKKEINSNHPLYKNKNTGVYMLNLNSKIMKNDLIDLHGITPCKSYNVQFPYVPEEYLHHFIRGYFDGDGYVNYQKYTVSFVGGSHSFMKSLDQILCEQNFHPNFFAKGKHYRIILSGRRTIKRFSEWIYNDKELFLQRKYEVFQQETLKLEQLQDRKLKRTKTAVTKRKKDFLIEYQQHNSISKSCESIGIKKTTFQSWIKNDLEFKNQFEHLTEIINKVQ